MRTTLLDASVRDKAEEVGLDKKTTDKVYEIWRIETKRNESLSHQFWNKREKFLERKRDEDIGCFGNSGLQINPTGLPTPTVKWKFTQKYAEKCQNWRIN